jgi:UDP-N-acetylmuramoylalanine--D-glutamate ligase
MSITELALQGKHNIYNSMASGIVAKVLELRNETMRESMGNFRNIEHRLEFVAKISGIGFINDSKGYQCKLYLVRVREHDSPMLF